MNTPLKIQPIQNARDSLDRMANELKDDDAFSFKGALVWGWNAVGLLAYLRLYPEREQFDAWVRDYLHKGDPALQVERDAHWEEKQSLTFIILLDLLSDTNLPSLKPEFYQGWQDRMSRCRELRQRVQQIIGCQIDEQRRQQLLLLLAAYHRLFRTPAEVIIDKETIQSALPALFDLIEELIDSGWDEARSLSEAVNRCRQIVS